MSENIVHVSQTSFDEDVLNADRPVLVDYWAEWCAPCRAIAPIVKELATQYGDKVKIVKLNIDENPIVPSKYGIRSIPTVLAFKDGTVVGQITGARPKSAFEEMVQNLV